MSTYTRYLFASAGINVTDQDIEEIDRFGHPDVLCQLIINDRNETLKVKRDFDDMVHAIWNSRQKG